MGMRVDWLPGHSGSIGNGAAHIATREVLFSRTSTLNPVPLTLVHLDTQEEHKRLKMQAERELKAKVPHNDPPSFVQGVSSGSASPGAQGHDGHSIH